jgi:tRNA_anti-like
LRRACEQNLLAWLLSARSCVYSKSSKQPRSHTWGSKILPTCMLHIANTHASYDDNQARFHRDYIGRQFSANLPIRQISESVFGSDTLVISLGSGTLIGDVNCKVSGGDNIRAAAELHKGQMVHVTCTVYDHSFGSIDLKECQISQ